MSDVNWVKVIVTVLTLGVLLLVACSVPAEPQPGSVVTGRAVVESIDLLMLESFPVQVHLVARGYLPDSCTRIARIDQTFDQASRTFRVVISTTRPADAICTQVLGSFEETIALEVEGLPAGTYTVDVNGVIGSFTLDVDNSLP